MRHHLWDKLRGLGTRKTEAMLMMKYVILTTLCSASLMINKQDQEPDNPGTRIEPNTTGKNKKKKNQ